MAGAVTAVVGTLALAAGLAWPGAPLSDPMAGAARPDLFGNYPIGTPPGHSPAAAAPAPSPTPSDSPSAQATPTGTEPPPAAASTTGPGLPPAPAPASKGSWTLVAQDDFTGSGIDKSKWQAYDSTASNGVSQWSTSMVSVGGGELRIAGHGRNPSGQGNVSGGVCWCYGAGNQTYGRWEVRARMEAGTGYGQAVLLWPQSNHWPEDGELDFAETPEPDKDTVVGTVHWGSDNRADDRRVNGDYRAWHTYAVEWQSTYVKMYVDDKLFYDSTTSSRHPAIPHTTMQLTIQQEPGPFGTDWVPSPNSSTPDTVTMHIDWVRIYR
jgi:beta-glucanase (GH16 family)